MADVDKDSKTEDATPKKLAELRAKGTVPQSPDVAGAAAVIAVLAVLALWGGGLAEEVRAFAERIFRLDDAHRPTVALQAFGMVFFGQALPIVAVAALAAAIATAVQTRGLFAFQSLQPDLKRLDPINGLKKILPTPTTLQELGKSLLKVAVVGALVYRAVSVYLPRFGAFPSTEPDRAAAEVWSAAAAVVLQAVVVIAALAAFDFVMVMRRFKKDTKMAKQEVKDEHKQSEGDPQVKSKRRAKQREVAARRTMIQEVADATVMVTNPTHISVALRYDQTRDAAPTVVALGTDEFALRLRAEARARGVPILENKPLARALHATAKVGQLIPVELYEMAAKVIAHVLRLRTERTTLGAGAAE